MTTEPKIDLGHGISYTRIVDNEGNWVGIHVWHPQCPVHPVSNDDSFGCVGAVMFEGRYDNPSNRATWTVHNEDPLDLSPSIHRVDCGLHGFIRNGQWVPA